MPTTLFLLATAIAAGGEPPPAGGKAGVLVLKLRPVVTAAQPRALLVDVATLEGGDPLLRQKVARLDLVELPFSGREVSVTREQVHYRLLLAGIDSGSFRLEGAAAVRISLPALQALETQVAAAARQELQLNLPGSAEDYTIRLSQPVRIPALQADPEAIRLQVELPQRPAVPGVARVDVGLYSQEVRRAVVVVYFDVRPVQTRVVAVRRIEAGEVLAAGSVRAMRMPADGKAASGATLDRLLGRRVRWAVAPGAVVGLDDIEDSGDDAPLLVRQRDLVLLVALVGGLRVTARGEALQEGRKGDRVRVRNVDSNKIVTGIVSEAKVVQVDLLGAQP